MNNWHYRERSLRKVFQFLAALEMSSKYYRWIGVQSAAMLASLAGSRSRPLPRLLGRLAPRDYTLSGRLTSRVTGSLSSRLPASPEALLSNGVR
jgi:hypothetical protein